MITTGLEFAATLERLRHDDSASWTIAVLPEAGPTAQLIETLCAFGNVPDGGTLIFGLDKARSFAPVGVRDATSIEHAIATQAGHQIEPPVETQLARVTLDGKTMVIVNVHGRSASARPHRVVTTHKAYLRRSDGNHVLSDLEIQQLENNGQGPRHDHVPVEGATREHLDPELTVQFLRAARRNSPRLSQADDTAVLRMKGVIEPAGERLTVAGLYALGSYPQQFLPNLSTTAVLRSTTTFGDLERREFDGPLPEQLEHAVRWVVRNIHTSARPNAGRKAFYATQVPISALREVIANALVHRDLNQDSRGQNIQLVLEDDRLIVTSPGGLWAVSTEQLGHTETQSTVNELLYGICRFTPVSGGHSVVNGDVSGLMKVNRALRSAGLQTLQLRNTGLQSIAELGQPVRITEAERHWLTSMPHELSVTQQYLLVAMSGGQEWSVAVLHDMFEARRVTALEEELQQLAALGLVETSSEREWPIYRLADAWLRHEPKAPTLTYDLEVSDVDDKGQPSAETTVTAQPAAEANEDRSQRAAASSKHGGKLWDALSAGAHDVHELANATNLNVSQVRYAMQRLVSYGLVHRSGGQGHRQTRYFVSEI